MSSDYLTYGDGTSTRQRLKKYVIEPVDDTTQTGSQIKNVNKCLILIHGGAWRDPNNTCDDFDDFVSEWRGYSVINHWKVYSIDYKLYHEKNALFPNLLLDILRAVSLIKADCEKNNDDDTYEYILCGHSVGSTIITQIIEYKDILGNEGLDFEIDLPSFSKAILLDGIYDITLLLEEYPDYEFFIMEHFGSSEKGKNSCNSITSDKDLSEESYYGWYALQNIVIVHSTKDELLSLKQPRRMEQWLRNLDCTVDSIYEDFGAHNDVYRSPKVAKLIYNYIIT